MFLSPAGYVAAARKSMRRYTLLSVRVRRARKISDGTEERAAKEKCENRQRRIVISRTFARLLAGLEIMKMNIRSCENSDISRVQSAIIN